MVQLKEICFMVLYLEKNIFDIPRAWLTIFKFMYVLRSTHILQYDVIFLYI